MYGWKQKTFLKASRPADDDKVIFPDHETDMIQSPFQSEVDFSQPYHEIDDDDDLDD